jgi:hypothetical protein
MRSAAWRGRGSVTLGGGTSEEAQRPRYNFFFSFIEVTSVSFQATYDQSWALVIGINEYQYLSPLSFATNDAKAVAAMLDTKFGFPTDNITILLDAEASTNSIRERFLEYTNRQRIRPDDRILVFFAGHGHTVTGNRGEVGYLVPADGRIDKLNTLIRWDELTQSADLIPAKHVFFLMDACYGGLALLRSPTFGAMRFMIDMLTRNARQVLTAGKANQTVADGGGVRPGHSIFTAHLLEALDGSAASEEGIITASGVMAYVYDRVGRDQQSHQTPNYGLVDGDGDFIFTTTMLDTLRKAIPSGGPGGPDGGDAKDILINPSASVVIETEQEPQVVEQMKDLLSDATKRIRLDDFVTLHLRRFLEATDSRAFPVHGASATEETLGERLIRYEELSRDLQQIVVLLATWGDTSQQLLLEKVFVRIAEVDQGAYNRDLVQRMTWFPILSLLYSAGIAAIASRKYELLTELFHAPVTSERPSGDEQQPLIVRVVEGANGLNTFFKTLPGHERHHVPRSEYLYKALQPVLEDLLLLGRRYEALYDEFEVLLALDYADLMKNQWGPPGRFAWKHRAMNDGGPFRHVIEDSESKGGEWGPLKAGLFGGSQERLKKDIETITAMIGNLPWL